MKSVFYAYALLCCVPFVSAADDALSKLAVVIKDVAASAAINPDPSDVIATVIETFSASKSASSTITLDPVAWGHFEGCEAR
jgi:hypothetical protein